MLWFLDHSLFLLLTFQTCVVLSGFSFLDVKIISSVCRSVKFCFPLESRLKASRPALALEVVFLIIFSELLFWMSVLSLVQVPSLPVSAPPSSPASSCLPSLLHIYSCLVSLCSSPDCCVPWCHIPAFFLLSSCSPVILTRTDCWPCLSACSLNCGFPVDESSLLFDYDLESVPLLLALTIFIHWHRFVLDLWNLTLWSQHYDTNPMKNSNGKC